MSYCKKKIQVTKMNKKLDKLYNCVVCVIVLFKKKDQHILWGLIYYTASSNNHFSFVLYKTW